MAFSGIVQGLLEKPEILFIAKYQLVLTPYIRSSAEYAGCNACTEGAPEAGPAAAKSSKRACVICRVC